MNKITVYIWLKEDLARSLPVVWHKLRETFPELDSGCSTYNLFKGCNSKMVGYTVILGKPCITLIEHPNYPAEEKLCNALINLIPTADTIQIPYL